MVREFSRFKRVDLTPRQVSSFTYMWTHGYSTASICERFTFDTATVHEVARALNLPSRGKNKEHKDALEH